MSIFDVFRRSEPTQLKLLDDTYGKSKVSMPKAPPLDVSLENLLKYSKRSELVYACIEKKAQAACDAEVVVEQKKGGEWEPVEGHPLVSLLNKPNPWDDGESFIRSWIASENFADNFYCEIVRSGAGAPVGLYPLNPVYLYPQYVSRMGFEVLSHYVYYIGGKYVEFKPEELLIRRRHGAGSVYSDVSPVAIALGSVDADAAMTDYVRAFFNNEGTPSGILTVKGKRLSDTEAQGLQQKWTQRFSRGGPNRKGIAVLDESAEFQTVGAKLNELGDETLNGKIETRICMAFGVPPILVGSITGLRHVTQNATSKAAMQDFWQYTMSPELKSIRKFLTWSLLPMFENIDAIKKGNIRVNWDMTQVSALQPDLDAVVKRTVSAYQGGVLTLNEARADLKLDAVDDEMGDEFFKLPAPSVNFGQMPEPVAPPNEDEPKQIGDGKAEWVPATPEMNREFIKAAIDGTLLYEESVGVLDATTLLEKKTFDYNGLTLGREPTELEKTIDLKGMVEDAEAGKEQMAKVLLSIRSKLIIQAEDALSKLDPKSVHELILDPPDNAYSGVRKVVDKLFQVGQQQVRTDLARQKAKKNGLLVETKDISDKWLRFLQKIVDRTMSRVISEIQTRAINFFVARGLLDRDDVETINELRKALEDQSTGIFDNIASSAANAAIGEGRDAEIEARSDEWEMVEYSAILDKNTCGTCEDADGMTASDPSELPDAPNPDCEGGALCRCFHVAIFKEGNA